MSDLISRQAVIKDIHDLLKSPYAHSQLGEANKETAFAIRKHIAETIIDLCVKDAKTAYDVDKVVEQLEDACCKDVDGMELPIIGIEDAIEIVKGGGKDE